MLEWATPSSKRCPRRPSSQKTHEHRPPYPINAFHKLINTVRSHKKRRDSNTNKSRTSKHPGIAGYLFSRDANVSEIGRTLPPPQSLVFNPFRRCSGRPPNAETVTAVLLLVQLSACQSCTDKLNEAFSGQILARRKHKQRPGS